MCLQCGVVTQIRRFLPYAVEAVLHNGCFYFEILKLHLLAFSPGIDVEMRVGWSKFVLRCNA